MSKPHLMHISLLLGILAASLGAGRALGQALDTVPIPTLSVTGARADSIVTDTRLTADRVWRLRGFTLVKTGRTLTIEPGTIIVGDPVTRGTLIVDTGAYLVAAGTRERPIIFKGPTEERGRWGGILLLGRTINNQGSHASFEGLAWARHGRGNNNRNNDSSGVLTYLQIINAGFPIDVDKELKGLTLCSVGNRTVIHHIQVHRSEDDGIAWFGGTVNTSHLVVTNAVDDSYDTDHGYSGNSQYMIAIQSLEPGTRPRPGLPAGEQVGDHIVECGSSTGNNTPHTNPVWKNLTFIENGIRGGVFNAKEDCGGAYEKMVMVASGVDTSVTSPWGMYIQGPDVLNRLLANPPTLSFPKTYLTGRYANKYLIDAGSAADREIAAQLLDLDITDLPYSRYGNYGLRPDLTPIHPAIIADSAGAIVGGDLWYQGWTVPNTVRFAPHESPIPGPIPYDIHTQPASGRDPAGAVKLYIPLRWDFAFFLGAPFNRPLDVPACRAYLDDVDLSLTFQRNVLPFPVTLANGDNLYRVDGQSGWVFGEPGVHRLRLILVFQSGETIDETRYWRTVR